MSYIKLHTTETTILFIFVGSFVWLMATTAVLPRSYGGVVGATGYFAIILIGFLVMELWCREMANPFPYLQMIVRPINEVVSLYTLPDKTRKLEMGHDQAAYLPLQYKTSLPVIGPDGVQTYINARNVIIHYHEEWTRHVHLRPGIANFRGYNVKHPATEIIEVRQLQHSPFSVEYGENVAVYQLLMGSQDSEQDVDIENFDPQNFKGATNEAKALVKQNESLRVEIAEVRRRANEWQTRCYSLQNENAQQRNEISGLKQAVTASKGLALEILLSLIEACHSLDKAARVLKGSHFEWLTKYVIFLAAFIGLLVYLYLDPQVTTTLTADLGNPLVAGAVAIVAVIALYIYFRILRRRK
jgi:hypothetical protein